MADCEHMDSLSFNLLQSMDDLVKTKVEMEKTMSEGFILLAKARMLLGKERVSMMQFPTSDEQLMMARYCVHRESSDEDILSLEERVQNSLKFDASDRGDPKKPDCSMHLRHRGSEKKPEIATEDEDAETSYEQTKLVLSKKCDVEPLKWFGVLVPQELKLAQKAFEKSVTLSIDCANIQNRIEKIEAALKVVKSVENSM
ncbi:coiled-coil domain-containing protein 115-like [Hetaerina americana]|uniref:coiled-coil domain-containing protein 115-like n=1 Tax=Hetaerina americana TaxID=62018 RepID=UPI003A7F55B8